MSDEEMQILIDKIMDLLSWSVSNYRCKKQEIYKMVCEELADYPGKWEDLNVANFATEIRKKLR